MCKIANGFMATLLLLCAYKDWRKREIPAYLLLVMGVGTMLFWFFCNSINTGQRLAGMLVGGLFLMISKLTEEAIGYGDSWIILILGIHMGVFKMLQTLCIASVLAGVISLFLLWKRKWKKNMTLPFIPFVAIVYLGVTICGN